MISTQKIKVRQYRKTRSAIKENMNSEFLKAWEELTDLIYEYEGSLGSRVHFERENVYEKIDHLY